MIRICALSVLLLLTFFAAPLPAEDPAPKGGTLQIKDAVTVNGKPILFEKFVEGLIRKHGKPYLDRLVTDALLEQAFARHGIKAEAAEVDARIKQDVKQAYRKRAANLRRVARGRTVRAILEAAGDSPEKMKRRMIADRQKSRGIFEVQVKVAKLVAYFLLGRDRIEVRVIVCKTRAEAEALLRKINDVDSGETFESLASQPRPGSKVPRGRTIHPFAREDFALKGARGELDSLGKAFADAAFSLKVGDHSSSVIAIGNDKVPNRYLIIKVLRRFKAQEGTYLKLEDQVKKLVAGNDRPIGIDERTWMLKQRQTAKIKTDPRLQKLFKAAPLR